MPFIQLSTDPPRPTAISLNANAKEFSPTTRLQPDAPPFIPKEMRNSSGKTHYTYVRDLTVSVCSSASPGFGVTTNRAAQEISIQKKQCTDRREG